MPYTIPSYAVNPGSVYQPYKGLPSIVKTDGRAAYFTRGGSIASGRVLDQLPSNNGTRRTGEEGRCYTADGTDDEVNFGDIGSAIWFSGWVKLNSDNQCLFSLSNDINTNLIVIAGVLTAGATLTLSAIKIDDVSKTASEAGVLLNDNAWHFLSCGIGDGLGGGSTADDVRFFTDGINHGSVSGFDWRFWATTPTASELTEAYSGATANRNSAALSKYALWAKCDEQSGTTAYDSSGNGLTGTLANITAGTFHATQDIWSFQNQVGYNKSGAVYIPRDESDPTNDVLGNPLTNIGRRPNDGKLNGSNCLTADGTLYIASAHLVGTETVVSSGGTSTPSISAGRIDFTAGTCWDLTLSDGTHYKLAEGYGTLILDASGNGNHGALTSATLANAWGATQDDYHSNLIDGSGKRMWFDGASNYVDIGTGISESALGTVACDFYIAAGVLGGGLRTLLDLGGTSSNGLVLWSNYSGFRLQYGNGVTTTSIVTTISELTLYRAIITWNGSNIKLYLNGSLIGSGSDAFLSSLDSYSQKIGYSSSTRYHLGSTWNVNIYNVEKDASFISSFGSPNSKITDSTNLKSKYNGYGNTDADWIDATGNGNDGTVVGSPEAFYISATPNGLDAFGNELTEKPSDATRNRAETTIDLNPDSTPEMGATQLGITVPSAHGFGDTLAASTQIFSRQRTLTEDRIITMTEAQSGDALATIQKYTQP